MALKCFPKLYGDINVDIQNKVVSGNRYVCKKLVSTKSGCSWLSSLDKLEYVFCSIFGFVRFLANQASGVMMTFFVY